MADNINAFVHLYCIYIHTIRMQLQSRLAACMYECERIYACMCMCILLLAIGSRLSPCWSTLLKHSSRTDRYHYIFKVDTYSYSFGLFAE